MSESLWLDPDEMHASAAELEEIADEVAQLVAELKMAQAREGDCWGGDKPGNAFAESFVPSAEQGMAGFENLVDSVRAISAGIRATTDAFANADGAGRTQVGSSDPASTMSADPIMQTYPSLDPTSRYVDQAAQATRQATGPTSPPGNAAAAAAGPSSTDDTAPATTDTDRSRPPEQQQSAPEPDQQQPSAPEQSDSADSSSPDLGASSEPDRDPQQPMITAPGAAAPVMPASQGPGTGTTTAPADPKIPAARADSARPAADSPWGRTPAGVPRPGVAGAAAPQENPVPPRASPPPNTGRPPVPAKPGEERGRTPAREPAPARARRKTGDEAMAILHEMASRHDLEIAGFETAGIAEQTAQEIADAVDVVLTKYPIILCGIQVADGGPPSLVENRNEAAVVPEAAVSEPPEPWIVLSGAAAADPGILIGRERAGPDFADTVLRQRPMYVTMLRELGHVLDLSGGARARAVVQRTLITEYLRISGAQNDNLGRIVSGYKSWRAELGDYCFDNGVFSAGRALAAGFAAVEVHRDDAPVSAKALHRLLVEMARTALPHTL
ncbi:hypothetical protein [Nocardia jinanensis]|uniref:WXG100 family type VII secretion target n=1 Tax=Nocardia jinanensis TaxID=382504 RepID=A0A917R522_9NOCA|nr:hypothetical protein [Nocardia jinanensis]GGK89777.1 hypothetical protein GCM10011588_00010 [Nocardia jinanensis]